MVDPIPDTYPRVVPYLFIDGAQAALDFYTGVFGAVVRMTMPGPDGKIGHAELTIGDSVIMVADEFPDMGVRGPKSVGGSPVAIHVYVNDVDATFEQALSLGATTLRPVEDKFYGDRGGEFEDPFGHRWSVASHVEDLTPEDMERRMGQMLGSS
jgi:PhnB protein